MALDPIDEWTDGDDEKDTEEDNGTGDYFVDWIEQATWRADEKQWRYAVKWSGYKRNANSFEPLGMFTLTTEMPHAFWRELNMTFEPKPRKGETPDAYVTPPGLLRQWMAHARTDRVERIAREREQAQIDRQAREQKALSKKKKVAVKVERTSKPPPSKPRSLPPPPRPVQNIIPVSDSDSSSASSDDDTPIARPLPPKPTPVVKQESYQNGSSSTSNGYGQSSVKGKEKEIRSGQSAVKKAAVKKPHYSGTDDSLDDERARKKMKASQPPRPKPKANISRPSTSSSTSTPRPAPAYTSASAPTSSQQVPPPTKRPLSESHSPPPRHAPPVPEPAAAAAPRPRPVARVNANSKPASKAKSTESQSSGLSSRECRELFQQKEKERKRAEMEAKRLPSSSRSGTPEVTKKQKKDYWGLGDKSGSNGDRASGTEEPDVKPPKSKLNGGDYTDSKPRSSSVASTSQNQIPKKPRTTVSLNLGPNPKSKHPTISTSTAFPLGLVDLTDITEPSTSVALPAGGEPSTLKALLGEREGMRREPEVFLEQTYNIWQAVTVLSSIVQSDGGGGVVQFCRVEAAVKGDAEDRSKREKDFKNMAYWLEESCVGGSISLAYLAQTPYSLIVIPRYSPICEELGVPPSLRDACRPHKESLIGALVILPRPTLPMPSRQSVEVFANKVVLDYHLNSYPISLSFINELRLLAPSAGIAIFAPRTWESLPGIAHLQEILTKQPEGGLLHGAAHVVTIPSEDADEAELRHFMPQVVLCHNAMSLYALPNLAELRKRPDTKFYSFGPAKDIYLPENKTSFREFGLGEAVQITLTPSVLLDEPGPVKKELIPLLKAAASAYKLVLHPSTLSYVNAECSNDCAPQSNMSLSTLMAGCRTGSLPSAPFDLDAIEPLNPTHDPDLFDRNADFGDSIDTAATYPDLVKECQTYCERDGSVQPGSEGEITLERAEMDVMRMTRSNLRHPKMIDKYRRFIIVGPTKSDSDEVEELRLGAESMSLEELLVELRGKQAF